MKRRYSISLGIAAVGSAAYLALLGWYVYTLFQGGDTGYPVTVEDLPFNLILHVCLALVATCFTWAAFFTGIFSVAAAACVCYTVGCIIFYHYLLFCAPVIICTLIGSVFCIRQQKKTQNKQAETAEQQKKAVQEKKQQDHVVHEKKPQTQRNTRQQMLTRRMQQNHNSGMQGNTQMFTPNYIQPMAQPYYAPLQDPYAPLTQGTMLQPMTQSAQMQTGMYPFPVYGNEQLVPQQLMQAPYQPMAVNQNSGFQQTVPAAVQNPFPQANQPILPYQMPMVNTQNQTGLPPQPHAGHTRGEGYFDDYGNFHPGGEQ